MNIAILLLTKTNPNIHLDKLISNTNTYIHPKYPDKINIKYQKYIIKNLINPTAWCDLSIVYATINLLETAVRNISNRFFILLSDDCYPLYEIDKLDNMLGDLSIFNLKLTKNDYYKTSQWWILNLSDANLIINTKHKYIHRFKQKNSLGCPDELYFLSVLKWENKSYIYRQSQPMYDKWLTNTIQRSPAHINNLLEFDHKQIKLHDCLFVRKITSSFSYNKYIICRKLYVIYIGTLTDQSTIILNDEFDLMLIISVNITEVRPDLIERCIYIYQIIYKFLFETILNICTEPYILDWELVIFTSEKFNTSNYNQIDKQKQYLPIRKLDSRLQNIKNFYYIRDNNEELAFCIKN
jgi:hypothetical protein